MPIVNPLSEEQMEESLRDLVQFFMITLGGVPNSVKTMAHRPEIAETFTRLNQAVMECRGALTPEFKRLIGYITSYVAGCRYCQAHTILAAERFGGEPDRLQAAFDYENSTAFTVAEKVALSYAFAASTVPNSVTEKITADLHQHWSDSDIVELTGVIALFGFLNRWNDTMGTVLEDLPTAAGTKYLAKQTGWTPGKHIA